MKIQLKSFFLFSTRKNVVFLFVFLCAFLFNFSTPQALGGACLGGGEDCLAQKGLNAAGGVLAEKVADGLKSMAVGLISAEAALANAAAVLFAWILDPNAFSLLMNNGAFYEMWKIVRDTMNMLFILVLLFSAFATIYQIDKYKYNKILWMVIIMALLVNFSWPIARTIVDFFSSMMYFFVQSVFGTNGTGTASAMLGGVDIEHIFLPKDVKSEALGWQAILLAIITMFIFMSTLLVLSLMLLIRLVALPVLVMFSPVGFAGMAAPFTQGYARKWWSKFFQYASYGPFSVFMVLVAIRVLNNEQMHAWKAGMKITASGMSAGFSTEALVTLIYLAIPITLFWMAITSAEKMSGELGGTTIKFGSNLAKWAGKKASGWNRGVAAYSAWDGSRKQARTEAEARSFATQFGKGVARKQNQLSASAGLTSGIRDDAQRRLYNEDAARVKSAGEKVHIEDQSVDELNRIISAGNKFEQAAATLELASRGLTTRTQLGSVSNLFGEGSVIDRQLRGKMRAYDPVAAFSYKNGLNQARLDGFVRSNQFDAKKLGADSLGDADFMRTMFNNNAISSKDLDELSGRSSNHKANITTSLRSIANSNSSSRIEESHRKIQSAYLAQTGEFSAAINADVDWKAELIKNADKEILKRIDGAFVAANVDILAANIKTKNYKSIIENMNDSGAQSALNEYVKSSQYIAPETGPPVPVSMWSNNQRLAAIANNDAVLRNIG